MGEASDSAQADAPLAVERLVVDHAVIFLKVNSKSYRIPCKIDILPEKAAPNQITCNVSIYLRGQELALTAAIDLISKTMSVKYSAKDIVLANFADLTHLVEGLSLSGEATLEGQTNLIWEPFTITSHTASIELHNTKISMYDVHIQNSPGRNGAGMPLRIEVECGRGTDWEVKVSEITALAPIAFSLSEISARIRPSAAEVQCDGSLKLTPGTSGNVPPSAHAFQIIEYAPIHLAYSARYIDGLNWSFDLRNKIARENASKINRVKVNGADVSAKTPVVKITGEVANGEGEAEYRVNIPAVTLASDAARITIPAVTATGSASIRGNPSGIRASSFDVQFPGTRIKVDTAEIKIPRLSLIGKSNHGNEKKPLIEAHLLWNDGSMALSGHNARFTVMKGKLPLQWPAMNHAQSGGFSIGRLQFQNLNLGSIRGKIRQTSQGIAFQGRHLSRLVPKLIVKFGGDSRIFGTQNPATNVKFQLAPERAAIDVDVQKLFAGTVGVFLSGNLSMDGNLVIENSTLQGSFNSKFSEGVLRIPDQKVSIEGISMAISMPDLPNFRSAPQQQIFIDKVAAGGIEFSNTKMDFQIESLRSLFIEKAHFKWSEGNVDFYALRLSPEIEDYRLILYCDRLNMAKVLEQFGAATAVGEGKVSGRIPVRYHNKRISFDDGFLFSTPGETGKIRLTDTDILTAGFAPGTPQYVQIELAREALKDYDVSWAKLNINSEGEDLLLRMQLDGKPAKILPFVYKKDLGGFAKIEAEGKGSKFQGIRLDVNFRLPLNEMLQYRDLIEMIQ
jgi:hypothetical protein